MQKLSKRLQTLRIERGNSQSQLATYLGVTKQAVSKWETGVAYPDITLLPKIAVFYDVTIDYLFDLDRNRNYDELVYKYYVLKDDASFEAAEKACDNALELNSNDIQALANKMFLYENAHISFLNKAKELCLRIKSEELNDFQKQAQLATLLKYDYYEFKNKQNINKYIQEYKLTHEFLPLTALLTCLEMEEEFENVVAYCDDYLTIKESDLIELKKANALVKLKKVDEAKKCYKGIINYSTNDNILYDCYYSLFELTRDEIYRQALLKLAKNDLMKEVLENL